MLEYLIRVESENGTFMVHAGFRKSFARQMCDTFTLRDENNRDIPHTKVLVEMHTEPRDMGPDGLIERPYPEASFEDFDETPEQERRRLLAEAEERITQAAAVLEREQLERSNRERQPRTITKKWGR